MASATEKRPSSTVLSRIGLFFRKRTRFTALFVTSLTLILVLLGEFTAAAGAGATCNFTYPGCAGHLSPIGLTIPQFIEWFHRFFAMLVGLLILGNAFVLWNSYRGTRISRAAWLAAVLVPLQAFLGGVTVTFATLFPDGYTPAVQLTHLATGLGLFLALVAAVVWIDEREAIGATANRLYLLGILGLGLTGAQAVVAPKLVVTFWPGIQTTFHLFGQLSVASFLVAVLWSRTLGLVDGGVAGSLGFGVGLANTFLVIGIFTISEGVRTVTYLLLFVQLFLFAWVAFIGSRAE